MQNSLQESPLSEFIASDLNFVFSGEGWANGETVMASKPIAVFNSLEALLDI